MDRTGKKKIVLYGGLSLFFLFLCVGAYLWTARMQYEQQLAWMLELSEAHPEIETDIVKVWKNRNQKIRRN